eukprot:TRINITY_DN4001_c0_g1_i5.p1 TRINITY_DN4001_c0_g1~~TRINITY_DN4001_c0_g1_i5.p1  ORF type:complete len:363 (+),score=72.54 TRINITY_DN4001_c0_g1_i5:129-1217(+)
MEAEAESILHITIRDFLGENTIYNVLPLNSQVLVFDKNITAYSVLSALVNNLADMGVMWNAQKSSFETLIGFRDALDLLLGVAAAEILEVDDRRKGEEALVPNDSMIQELMNAEFQAFKKASLFADNVIIRLRNLRMKTWEEIMAGHRRNGLIECDREETLAVALEKMTDSRVKRVAVRDKDSALIVGCVSMKDILSFVVRFATTQSDRHAVLPIPKALFDKATSLADWFVYEDELLLLNLCKMQRGGQNNFLSVVSRSGEYRGLILRRDIIFIIRGDNYVLLSKTCGEFLAHMEEERKAMWIESISGTEFYTEGDNLRILVEKLLFSHGNVVTIVEKDSQKYKGVFTISDLFDFFIGVKSD